MTRPTSSKSSSSSGRRNGPHGTATTIGTTDATTSRPGTPSNASRRSVAIVASAALAALVLLVGPGAPDAPGSSRENVAMALPPDRGVCSGGGSFCGAVLRVDSSTGTIPSVAAGSHYGPAWGIPPAPNDSVGTGWCVDDTHTGFPAGPITEQPLPGIWSSSDHRVAASVIALYGGDRVLPYQPLPIDDRGELVVDTPTGATPTRLRHIAVWVALRSVLADPAGTPRIDLATATTFSDRAGRSPSELGDAAVRLARRLIDAARRLTVSAGRPNVEVLVDDPLPTRPGDNVEIEVRVSDPTGRPVALVPVWPDLTTNVAVDPVAPTDPAGLQAHQNAQRAGWPSFDTTTQRSAATVTGANGVATFRLELAAADDWSARFATETAPTRLQLFGDDIRAQNNVSLRAEGADLSSATIDGDATVRHLRIVKTSSDDDFAVAGATFTVVDASDLEVGRATTGDGGSIDLVVSADHRPPFRIREIEAPPGLRAIVEEIVVGDDEPLSTDAGQPTVVTVENEPELHEVSLSKRVLDAPDPPTDLAGFAFTIVRRSSPGDVTDVVTGADGRTPTIRLVAGDYDVTEVARPAWWPGDDPVPASTTLSIPLDTTDAIVFGVDNTFPSPPATTTSTTTTSTTLPATPTTLPPATTVPPSTSPPSAAPPASTTTTTTTATSTTVTPPTDGSTTTSTTSSTTTTPPTSTTSTTTTTVAPTPTAPPPPTLPRTGGEVWREWFRIGSFVVLAGAALFCASTVGLATRHLPTCVPSRNVRRHGEGDGT